MSPLSFCLVTTFYPPFNFGGDGVQVRRTAAELAARGHRVKVVHAADSYRTLGGRAAGEIPSDPGVEVVAIETGMGAAAPLATHLSGRPLLNRRVLGRELAGPYDVLHFNNPSLIGGPAVLRMGRAKLRLYTAHEQWLLCPTHTLFKNNREVCTHPTCTSCSLAYRRPPQLWRSTSLLSASVTELDALIAPSRTSARLHERFGGTVRIAHIPHFVPHPPAAVRFRSGRPYFLFVGRHEPIKGLDQAIDAFRRRSSEDLLIAGEGPLTDELRRSAADLPHVHFLGWQDGEALDSLYRGALAVLVPTRGHEAFGLVPVEAFARGTPAIVHDFGALGEIASEARGGIAYRDDAELDEALEQIAASPALRARLGAEARAAYLSKFTPESHFRRYFGLIEDLAERRGEASLARLARASVHESEPEAHGPELVSL